MPRIVEITVPSGQMDGLIGELRPLEGVIGMRVARGSSLQPPGDVLTVETTNRSLHELMRILHTRRIGAWKRSYIHKREIMA